MRQPLSLPKKNPALQKVLLCVLDRDQHDHWQLFWGNRCGESEFPEGWIDFLTSCSKTTPNETRPTVGFHSVKITFRREE